MKQFAVLFLFGFIGMIPKVYAQSGTPAFEFHVSGNHTLSSNPKDQTFLGGGLGANIIFRDARALSFKTGLETLFFHTWNPSVYTGKMSGKSNVHYHYCNLSVPVMFRLNAGKKVKIFAEAGGYFGIPLFGNATSRFTTTLSYPGESGVSEVRKEAYRGSFSLTVAAGVGGIIPVSPRVELIVKPEIALRKSLKVLNSPESDFNDRFHYFRLCLGIRINLNEEIE